jgi:glycosyltransferase involved in cell wall biosynthesis
MSQDPLHLLVIEPRFPGPLAGVADALVRRRGYRATLMCHVVEPAEYWPASVGNGLDVVQFQVGGVAREPAVSWTRDLERAFCYAYGAWEVFDARRIRPVDLVLGRSAGLGSTLFAPVSYPRVPIVQALDYHVHPTANDLAEVDLPALPVEYRHWRRAATAMDLLDLENGVRPWTFSHWQRNLFPPEYRNDFRVLHHGIDAPDRPPRSGPRTRPCVVAGRSIPPDVQLVTYVSRRLDRLRGFDRFVALADRLLAEREDVLCVAVGGGPVERALDVRFHGQDYAAALLGDRDRSAASRLWCPGNLTPRELDMLLEASDLHIAPGRPYPVARSTFEAMAVQTPILAWDTAPVREVLTHEQTGWLVPPGDAAIDEAAAIARAILNDPAAARSVTRAARAVFLERFDRAAVLPEIAGWFHALASGEA